MQCARDVTNSLTIHRAPGYVPPEAIADPWEYIELYRKAAKNARSAGFDGVELHAANGYLPNQFLEAHSNQRTDDFGGSAQKRAKFIIEATKALIDGFGGSPQRVGIKLSPCGGYNDMGDSVEVATEEYSIVIQELEKLGVGYFQFSRYNPYMDPTSRGTPMDVIKVFGPMVKKAHVLVNNSVQPGEAEEMLEKGLVAGAVIGRDFLANPDLPSRWALGKELNPIDYATLYGAQSSETRSKGYTDYPTAK